MNRAFYIPGFKQRVKQVLDEQGKTGAEVAALCGFERKALYNEDWHGGRIAKFCEVTGTDANWLLGIRGPDLRRYVEKPFITECRNAAIEKNMPLYFVYYEETGIFEVYITATKELFEKRHCSKHLLNFEFEKIATRYLDAYTDWEAEQ